MIRTKLKFVVKSSHVRAEAIPFIMWNSSVTIVINLQSNFFLTVTNLYQKATITQVSYVLNITYVCLFVRFFVCLFGCLFARRYLTTSLFDINVIFHKALNNGNKVREYYLFYWQVGRTNIIDWVFLTEKLFYDEFDSV